MLITAAVALDDLDHDYGLLDDAGKLIGEDWEWEKTANLARGACGFLVFVVLVVMIVESIIIALRFLNLGIMDRFTFYFHIVVSPLCLPFLSLYLFSTITCPYSSP